MNELKPETVHDCWKSLWSEVMSNFKGFHGFDGEVKKSFTQQDKLVEQNQPTYLKSLLKHTEEHLQVLTSEKVKELVESFTKEEDE